MNIQIKFLNALSKSWGLPEYQTLYSAGLDLRACIDQSITLAPRETFLIPTGLSIYLDNPEVAAVILPRSGLGHNKGLILGNTIGLIDADYQGELKISCWNRSEESIIIESGMRIAQLVILPIIKSHWEVVENFTPSVRGDQGFGSTGH